MAAPIDILLRELQLGADGIAEYHDTEFSGERIAIGSAADSTIQLLGVGVAAQHAVIRRAGERIELRCARGCTAKVNGTDCTTSLLTIGDAIEIAGNRLAIAKAPAGFHFAVEIQTNPNVDSSEFERAFRTEVEQTWISKRRLSWLALVVVMAVGFAIPLAGVLLRGEKSVAPSWLPSDSLWSTGALIPAHAQAAGDRCNHCHQTLFVHVRDAACSQCHTNIANHVGKEHAALANLATPQRCATCHREHTNSPANIIVRADQVCTECHAQADKRFAGLKMSNVKRFEPEQHPPFSANLLVPVRDAASAAITWQTIKTPLAGAREQSNLKFSHQQHLDGNKVIRLSDGAGLGCNDCHKLNSDGKHFAPITMQSSCASCHELTFDTTAPERQLPHAKPREAMLMLQEYFARKYSDPAAAPKVRERRRLPGHEAEEAVCTGSNLECARQMASAEINLQFTKRGCVSCHEVTDTQSADLYERFQVLPVRLSDDFFPSAHFNHRAHGIQKERTGDAACLSCHVANKSEQSSDLLLPGITQCLECHRSRASGDQIVSQCVSCHGYHPRNVDAQKTIQNPIQNPTQSRTLNHPDVAASTQP